MDEKFKGGTKAIASTGEIGCPKGKDCPAISFHEIVEWVLNIARSYDLASDSFSDIRTLVDEFESADFLDSEICKEIAELGRRHDEIARSSALDQRKIDELQDRINCLHRAILSVVVIDDDNDDDYTGTQ